MSGISTHVLDTSRGTPAAGVAVTLERDAGGGRWATLASTKTDADGRVKTLLPDGTTLSAATYRLRFESGAYFRASGAACFHPRVEIVFDVTDASKHHHVPLLISPFGYTTYRGT